MSRRDYVTGDEAIRRVFRRMSREMRQKLEAALLKGAYEIVDDAERLVPEDRPELINTIEAERTGNVTPVRMRADGKAVAVYVVAGTTPETAQAAWRTEFGRAPSADHPGHVAQPFFWPAYWRNKQKITRRVARAIRAAAQEAARRGGR